MKFIDTPVFFLKTQALFFLLCFFSAGVAFAAAAKTTPVQQQSASLDITKATLAAKIEAINARQGLDDATKSKVLKLYQSAEDNLGNIELFTARTSQFKQAIKQAPYDTKRLQKEIADTQTKQTKQKPENFLSIPTEELEQRLIIEKEKLSNLDEQLNKVETELALQSNRPALIRQEMVTAQQDIETNQKNLEIPATDANSQLQTEAGQAYIKTLLDARTAELKMLDIETISNPARVELLKTQWQLMDLQKSMLSAVITAIETLLADRRQQEAKEAQEALRIAEQELSGKPVVIQTITRENFQYSKDLQAITAKIDSYNEQKNRYDAQAKEIDTDFKSAEKKISLAGVSPALGKILREQRRNLLAPSQWVLQSETLEDETALTSLQQFKVEDSLKKLADIDARLLEIMATQVDHKMPQDQRMMIQAELRVLLNSQKELLGKLYLADTTYLRTLGDFDFAKQQMEALANKFAVFLDKRLLWVPSSEPINGDYLAALYHSTQWLLSPVNWLNVAKDALKSVFKRPFVSFVALLSLVFLLSLRRAIQRELTNLGDKVDQIYTDTFYYTLKALVYCLLRIAPIPLFFYYGGWFLTHYPQAQDFSQAIGVGLQRAAVPLFFLQFFYSLFAPTGIARKHFQWQSGTTSLLHRQIAWIRFIAVPAVFIINSTNASKTAVHSDSMGRIALIASMVAVAIFFHKALRPSKGLLQKIIANNPTGWLSKTRYIWYPLAILLPLTIIGFAAAGYYLSALELQQKLIITLRLVVLTLIVHALVFRWLTLVNRQLAMENAKQKRKAVAQTEKHNQQVVGGEDPVLPIEDQLIDIPKINAQTIRLLNVFISFTLIIGCWMIWKNILPAFSFLENIVLWQHLEIVDKQEVLEPTTFPNLLLAGLYAFIAAVSVRNFSGVMELLVFRRMTIEAGSRYAINQLAKYVIVAISFICVANELGGSWSQVQWLVAALSVGLGFGLQEIFANLVSGIILLFERPIRVGDTVTIGDVTGKVSRIQMRATTIMDWDQKELIVPNKTFITNQLVNWTLSDAVTRVVIPVGIAYGSNIDLAHKVMLETIQKTPLVLADPEPNVLFMDFGASSLDFSVRVYVSELAHRLQVVHDLHIRLERALRENNIEIPFPQHDVHIRSVVRNFDDGITPAVQKI
ncbi:MAG: mechanosensitive ion channel [Methylovulum sp.]|nr:mechanosensitive ion channel [Methylovulum sp.]